MSESGPARPSSASRMRATSTCRQKHTELEGFLLGLQADAPSGALLPAIGPRLSCADDVTPDFWDTRSGTSGRGLHDHSLLVGRHASQALSSLPILANSQRMCEKLRETSMGLRVPGSPGMSWVPDHHCSCEECLHLMGPDVTCCT